MSILQYILRDLPAAALYAALYSLIVLFTDISPCLLKTHKRTTKNCFVFV